MALANFFDKVNLGASQRLLNHDRGAFETKLLSQSVAVFFSAATAESFEGRTLLDLLTRLLCRLYPNVSFICDDIERGSKRRQALIDVAQQINPEINCSFDQTPTVGIVVGKINTRIADIPLLFIGSENWTGYLSPTMQQKIGGTSNPFGAAVAACLASANLFRQVFTMELGNIPLDSEINFSAFSQKIGMPHEEPQLQGNIDLNFSLIGTGAIGNAVIWAFLQIPDITGNISLVDQEPVALSNLQRYVLMFQNHLNQPKVEVLQSLLLQHTQLQVHPYHEKWQDVLGNFNKNQLELIATAVDTAADRLKIQGVLPKKIINAWTSPESLGISRHNDFLNGVCLSCLYFPGGKSKSESEKIAIALNMEANEIFIRRYLANKLPIDDVFIQTVHQSAGFEIEKLTPYKGQPVQILYSDGICGGRIISAGSQHARNGDIEVPLAHESVLVGILLAAEVIIESTQLRSTAIDSLTKIDLLHPLHENTLEKESKHYSNRCICQDIHFRERYKEKWL